MRLGQGLVSQNPWRALTSASLFFSAASGALVLDPRYQTSLRRPPSLSLSYTHTHTYTLSPSPLRPTLPDRLLSPPTSRFLLAERSSSVSTRRLGLRPITCLSVIRCSANLPSSHLPHPPTPTRLARQFPLCSPRLKTWRISERRREFAIITGRIIAGASIVISHCANIRKSREASTLLPVVGYANRITTLVACAHSFERDELAYNRTGDDGTLPRRRIPLDRARGYARLPPTFPRSPSSSRKFVGFSRRRGERRLFTRSPFAGCCDPCEANLGYQDSCQDSRV